MSRDTIVVDRAGRLAAFRGGIAEKINRVLGHYASDVERARLNMQAAAARAAQRRADQVTEGMRAGDLEGANL